MKSFANLLAVLALAASAAGCRGQASVTPPPTISASDTAASCPTGYTCAYIWSWAGCPTVSSCPTPGNPGPGPYTPLETPTTALTAPSYSGPAPIQGGYVAMTVQVVFTNLTPPWVGAPSPVSAAQLVSLYPPTLGAPSLTTTAGLAPALLPDAPQPQVVASNQVPQMGKPTVQIIWPQR